MLTLSQVNEARLFALGLAFLIIPLSAWFWLSGLYSRELKYRRLAVGIFCCVAVAIVLAQIEGFRTIAKVRGRLVDNVLPFIVFVQTAISLAIGFFREKIRETLRTWNKGKPT